MRYERLHEMREDRDFTQQQVADYLKVSLSAYKNYELGIRSIPVEILIELALFYQTSVDYLIGLTNRPSHTPTAGNLQHQKINRVDGAVSVKQLILRMVTIMRRTFLLFIQTC